MCKAIRDLMDDSREEGLLKGREEGRLEGRILTIKNFIINGASYEMVRASVKDLTDEELQVIFEEVCA